MSTDSVFLGYQQRWIADEATVKVAEKSRRVGLTWGEAADDVLIASRAEGGMDVWYIGYNQDMGREYIETCGAWARHFGEAASEVEEILVEDEKGDIQAFRIRFASGRKITALSSRPSNLRGKQGVVVIDEAAFHPDLAELLKAAFALTIWGGRVRVISTHDGVDNAFNQLCNDIRAGRLPYSLHRIDFDDALGDGLYRRICQRKGVEWTAEGELVWRKEIIDLYGPGADEELFCVPSEGGGAYLPAELVERRSVEGIPVVRWSLPSGFATREEHARIIETRDFCEAELRPLLEELDPGRMSFFGEDFARKGDLTVIWPVQMMDNLVRRPPFIVELRNVPFEQQKQVLFYIVDRLPRFIAGAMDATGNGMYLAEVAAQRYGAERIAQVMINEPWYRESMPKFKAAFEDGLVALPRDADIVGDHRAIKLVRGVATVMRESKRGKGEDGKKGAQRHGDAAIAHLMAYVASLMEVVEYDYQSTRTAGAGNPHHDQDPDREDDDGRARFGAGAY